MKMYIIPEGTEAVLIKNDNGYVTQQPWKASKDLTFERENIKCDPLMVTYQSFDPRSLAFQLAKKGYAIFVDNPTEPNKYALAVKYNLVEVV